MAPVKKKPTSTVEGPIDLSSASRASAKANTKGTAAGRGVASGRVTKAKTTKAKPTKKEPDTPKDEKDDGPNDEDKDTAPNPPAIIPTLKKNQACTACRKAKARCVRTMACERCVAAGVACPGADDEHPLATGKPATACARCRKLKGACVRRDKCERCEKNGGECVLPVAKA